MAGPLAGLIVGAFFTYLNIAAAWRRREAVEVRVKLVQAYHELWRVPTAESRRNLSLLLAEVEARCSGLGIDPAEVRRARDAVLRLHDYVDDDVDVDSLGRGEVIFHAMEAPEGFVEETWQLLDHIDRELAKRSRPWWGRKPKALTPPFRRLETSGP